MRPIDIHRFDSQYHMLPKCSQNVGMSPEILSLSKGHTHHNQKGRLMNLADPKKEPNKYHQSRTLSV